jgi:hypothetical protein
MNNTCHESLNSYNKQCTMEPLSTDPLYIILPQTVVSTNKTSLKLSSKCHFLTFIAFLPMSLQKQWT